MTLSTSLVQPLEGEQPIKLVKIPAGQFLMGSPAGEKYRFDNEGPQHLVTLKSFFLGQTPVTQAQWRVVARWPKIQLDLDPARASFWGPNRPIEYVSWEEAMEFCQRLNQKTGQQCTLPSEAQWEYACRAGTTTPFAFGETLRPDMASYSSVKEIYREKSTDVCSFPANAWELYDMHGNVWEWCADHWHDTYDNAPTDGSPWIDDSGNNLVRVLRGGSWFSNPWDCRSASRHRGLQDDRFICVGFRLCAPCHD
jgi:formylglycine-generating enzyme required for sulfatase activity